MLWVLAQLVVCFLKCDLLYSTADEIDLERSGPKKKLRPPLMERAITATVSSILFLHFKQLHKRYWFLFYISGEPFSQPATENRTQQETHWREEPSLQKPPPTSSMYTHNHDLDQEYSSMPNCSFIRWAVTFIKKWRHK